MNRSYYSISTFSFKLVLLWIFLVLSQNIYGQYTNIPLGYDFNRFIDRQVSQDLNHSSFKPLIVTSIKLNIDSILESDITADINLFNKRLFNKHLILLEGEGYKISGSLLSNLSLGYEKEESQKTFTNTRGFIIDGFIGSKVSFQTSFVENQSVFPNYVDSLIRTPIHDYVIPGQGRGRTYNNNGFDYAMSSGFVSIEASNNFTLQFGHGKHFIGNGYRSLLLSDNAFNYPFLRLQTNFGDFEYTNLYAEFQDMKNYLSSENDYDYMGYSKKYMSAHYLSYNFSNKLTLGIYESIIWKANHALGANGFDVNYLNPIIFLRPVEYSIDSPDNTILGLNIKYNISERSNVYGQLVLDEFTLKQMRSDNGYWANKYGYQLGYKYFDLFNIPNLFLNLERNYVRPYTYSHWNSANYGHYNEELAHPLGANFTENIFLLHYRKNRFSAFLKYLDIIYGADYLGDSISYGNNIYADYNNRPSDFGIQMYHGNRTDVDHTQLNIGYILNPTTNLKVEFSLVNRKQESDTGSYNTLFYSFSLKSDLFNHYYDY